MAVPMPEDKAGAHLPTRHHQWLHATSPCVSLAGSASRNERDVSRRQAGRVCHFVALELRCICRLGRVGDLLAMTSRVGLVFFLAVYYYVCSLDSIGGNSPTTTRRPRTPVADPIGNEDDTRESFLLTCSKCYGEPRILFPPPDSATQSRDAVCDRTVALVRRRSPSSDMRLVSVEAETLPVRVRSFQNGHQTTCLPFCAAESREANTGSSFSLYLLVLFTIIYYAYALSRIVFFLLLFLFIIMKVAILKCLCIVHCTAFRFHNCRQDIIYLIRFLVCGCRPQKMGPISSFHEINVTGLISSIHFARRRLLSLCINGLRLEYRTDPCCMFF